MRITVVMAMCVVAATGLVAAGAPPRPPDSGVIQRFLSDTNGSLVSYRAVRRLTASTRGGKMQASLTASTSLDPEHGFHYDVIDESGSGMIRSRVLHAALETERQTRLRGELARSALSEQNYTFVESAVTSEGLVRIGLRPRRKDTMLLEGTMLLTSENADLVRVEGSLVKRPSFWTRRVQVVRDYARIAGVRVPIAMTSTADVLVAGRSTFSMKYEYEIINGVPVQGSEFRVQSSRFKVQRSQER